MKNKQMESPVEGKSFEVYADNYDQILDQNLKIFTNDTSKFTHYKVEYLLSKQISPTRILDFGCGNGRATRFLKQAFPKAELWGCDVSEKIVHAAKKNFPDAKFFFITKPEDLGIYEEMFDLIFISCVVHHIIPKERLCWVKSLANSLSFGGKISIFEHNPYNPLTRYCVAGCEFDTDTVLLSIGECKKLFATELTHVSSQYTLFFPWRTRFFQSIERLLTWLPLGGQYCIILEKNASDKRDLEILNSVLE